MMTDISRNKFDYSLLDSEKQLKLRGLAEQGRLHAGQALMSIISLGRVLFEAKEELNHEQFLEWATGELGVPRSEAYKLINIYQRFGDDYRFSLREVQQLTPTVLKVLSSPSCPEDIADSIIESVAVGSKPPSKAETKQLLELNKESDHLITLDEYRQKIKEEADRELALKLAEEQRKHQNLLQEQEAKAKELENQLKLQQQQHQSDLAALKALQNEYGKEVLIRQAEENLKVQAQKLKETEKQLKLLKSEEEKVAANLDRLHKNSYSYSLQDLADRQLELFDANSSAFTAEFKKQIDILNNCLDNLYEPETLNYLKNTDSAITSTKVNRAFPKFKKEAALVTEQLNELLARFASLYSQLDKNHMITTRSNIDWDRIQRLQQSNGNNNARDISAEVEVEVFIDN